MSMLLYYEKEMTPCRVKTKERGDLDINALVKHGASSRLSVPSQTYADLTGLPQTRGEATQRLLDLAVGQDPQLLEALLRMGPAQAYQTISAMRPPASTRDDKNNAERAGSATPPSKGSGLASEAPKGPQ